MSVSMLSAACMLVTLLGSAYARLRVPSMQTHGHSGRAFDFAGPAYPMRISSSQPASHTPACASSAVTNSTLRNPPAMRTKNPQLCDASVEQTSGYVDLDDATHVFFWHFGSRQRLSADFNGTRDAVPLVFWFSGGPGCSSQIANWQENGPCTYVPRDAFDAGISDDARKKLPHEVRRNAWAWNNVADVVYVDQPVGTGFSHGPQPNSTEAAADTAWRVMQAVYARLAADARARGDRVADKVALLGESYAGRYIPVFAEYTWHMNRVVSGSADLRERGFVELPLLGIGIGNGLYDYATQAPTYHTIACQSSYPALFSPHQCAHLKNTVNPACSRAMRECYEGSEPASSALAMRANDTCVALAPEPWRASARCVEADRACNAALGWTTMVSTYDVRPGARLVPDDYVEYLRSPEFAQAVGVDDGVAYDECSDDVFDAFSATADEVSRSAVASLEFLLDARVPVLLYSGDADFICNWYGTLRVARALKWRGQDAFAKAQPSAWAWPTKSGRRVDAGQLTQADNLAFLRVYEAGHEVPFYQPQASLYMLAQFLAKQRLW
ncbi:hypothetical protein GGI15_002807 [Coemansia interrupta]|uniref:Carboxypeptidase n=1 Tax=Coemansia interrupta TaxID=1126814 RepID=A0A9W8LKE9_9FUNG|nr:hypothetical protein GGI15_002807 [Coemansia interrupta]